MNRIQYRRWKDFANRMARNGWSIREVMRKEHQTVVIPAVQEFFSHMEWDYKDDVIRIESWDDTRTDTASGRDCYGHYSIGPYVCDIVSEFLSNYNPFHWDDEESDKAYEHWDDNWGGRVHCCLRAGLDLASEPSAGVAGFTKGDLERMYPDGVPMWIQNGWCKQNTHCHPIDWDDIQSEDGLWT